jgi:hypothetical protein
MNLKQLAAKPQLVKLILDDEDTIKEFGEPLDFYIYDRPPIGTFVKLAGLTAQDLSQIVTIINDLILDENGDKIVSDEMVLPQKLYIRVVEKVVKQLGE